LFWWHHNKREALSLRATQGRRRQLQDANTNKKQQRRFPKKQRAAKQLERA
jgi:hypothetical protein